MRRVVSPVHYGTIVARYLAGGISLQTLGNDYGVSRERIRQIIEAVTPGGVALRKRLTVQQRNSIIEGAIEQGAENIRAVARSSGISYWVLLEQATEDQRRRLHRNRERRLAAITHKVCMRCEEFKPLTDYYVGSNHPTSTSACKPCASAIVTEYSSKRWVPEPTVTEKFCGGCHRVLPADQFYRAHHMNSGLQSTCKPCCSRQALGESVAEIAASFSHDHDKRVCEALA